MVEEETSLKEREKPIEKSLATEGVRIDLSIPGFPDKLSNTENPNTFTVHFVPGHPYCLPVLSRTSLSYLLEDGRLDCETILG